ncbi:MAG: MBL fold metallo-hydrolase [Deltaproteobacteria bacterium]|nr:MBL fold metallo-hydrolase [Deltaproteobacteria bacterium]
MRFSVLASGSGGNACYVETAHSKILIDAGLTARELSRRLDLIRVKAEDLEALLITHEHTDHIRGAGPLARQFDIPVFINRSTLKKGIKTLGNLSRPITVHTGQTITINDLLIETFTKCHDAVDPIGVVISSDGIKLGIVTDLGRSTGLVEDRLKGCQALIIEFNYDRRMLEEGPYPLELQRRIKGPDGHLSNQQAGELLKAVYHEDLRLVILAHLSEANNLPEKALQEANKAITRDGQEKTRIVLSHQDSPTEIMNLSS